MFLLVPPLEKCKFYSKIQFHCHSCHLMLNLSPETHFVFDWLIGNSKFSNPVNIINFSFSLSMVQCWNKKVFSVFGVVRKTFPLSPLSAIKIKFVLFHVLSSFISLKYLIIYSTSWLTLNRNNNNFINPMSETIERERKTFHENNFRHHQKKRKKIVLCS